MGEYWPSHAADFPTDPPPPRTEPGWYQDPGGVPRLRWFDGQEWSNRYMPITPSAPERRRWLWPSSTGGRLAVFSTFAAIITLAALAVSNDWLDESNWRTSPPPSRSYVAPTAPTAPSRTTAAAATQTLLPTDFTIDLIITKQSCFGSAGCNITYTPDVTWVGTGPLPDTGSFTIVYEIRGGEEPQIANIEVRNGQVFGRGGMISADQGTVLTAKVIRILP